MESIKLYKIQLVMLLNAYIIRAESHARIWIVNIEVKKKSLKKNYLLLEFLRFFFLLFIFEDNSFRYIFIFQYLVSFFKFSISVLEEQ